MIPFSISRIDTPQGIFKVTGVYSNNDVMLSTLSMMGTDGWVNFDINKPNVKSTILTITPQLLAHLCSE